ncbi:MAG: hypothetical protein WC752_04600 [Patescibacteria group bacterium]|jgi:hypothetical protein
MNDNCRCGKTLNGLVVLMVNGERVCRHCFMEHERLGALPPKLKAIMVDTTPPAVIPTPKDKRDHREPRPNPGRKRYSRVVDCHNMR